MPPYRTSPWQDAASSVEHMGNSFQNMVLGLAQLRAHQGMQAQLMGLREQTTQSEVALRNAEAQRYLMQAAIDERKRQVAADLSKAMFQKFRPAPEALMTKQGSEQFNMGSLAAAAAESGALSGQGMDLLKPHNVGQNDIATDAMGNEIAAGPVVLGQNAMYQRDAQSTPIRNEGRVTLGPQDMSVDPTGHGKSLYNPHVRPHAGSAGAVLSKNNALTARLNPGFEDLPGPWQQLVDSATNAPTMGNSSGGRIRVKGPNGEKGTLPADSELPEGWEYADP